MKIQWIFHHNPDLIVYGEDGSKGKSIDLADYNYEQLHELFKTHFRTKVCSIAHSHEQRTPHMRLMVWNGPRLTGSAPPVQAMVDGQTTTSQSDASASPRRLAALNASTSWPQTPPLLNDASAPQPDLLGWRLADTLAEWVSCCDSLQQALLYLLLGGALMALLAKLLLSSWCRRQRTRTSKDTALLTANDSTGICHIA